MGSAASAVTKGTPGETKPGGAKRYSPAFLAVFAVFLIATLICVAGMLFGVLSARPTHHDTQWFWVSGRLLVHGQNPYDEARIRQMETGLGLAVGRDLPMTRNPPPALMLMIPLGLLGPRAGVIAWSLLLAACLAVSVLTLRSMPRQPYERNYLLLAWCFAPALCCIEMGQMGLFVLAGLALFLWLDESKPFWAGAALSLCAVKPHLLIPFGVVLVVWIAARKRWAVLMGAVTALAVESLVVMLLDHSVWAHYRAAMRNQRFVDEAVPTVGVALRFLVDRAAMWVEFVPAALGSAWGLWYFWRNRERWDWRTHGSLLTLVSLVAAPYAWFTDQVIALPAILFALTGAVKPKRGSVTLLLAIMSAAAAEMIGAGLYSKIFIFQAVAWLAWYLYAASRSAEEEGVAAGTAN